MSLGSTEKLTEGIISPEKALLDLLESRINSYLWNKVYRKDIFEGILFPEGRVWEDAAVMYKVFLRTKRFYCLDQQLYTYLRREGSITTAIGVHALESMFRVRYGCYMDLLKNHPEFAYAALPKAALASLRLIDRSLYEAVNQDTLADAKAFLQDNRKVILNNRPDFEYKLYFSAPKVYNILRIYKHRIGTVVKKLRLLMKKF